MEARYELHFSSHLRIQHLCNYNDAFLMNLDEYPFLKDEYALIIDKIHAAKAINLADITHHATNKEIMQKVMVDYVFEIQRKARVKARQIHNMELYLILKKQKNYMTSNDDATVADKAEEIKEIIKKKLTLLINIQPAEITKAELYIANYVAVLNNPKEAINERSTLGTNQIPVLLKEADITRDDLQDIFHVYLPEKAKEFDLMAKIGKPTGARHTSIIIRYFLSDSNVPLKGISCTIKSGSISHIKKSTKKGYVRFFSLPNAPWSIVSTNKNYITDTQNIITDNKKIIRIQIHLQKKLN